MLHYPRGKIMRYSIRRLSAVVWIACLFVCSLLSSPVPAVAAEQGSLHGAVRDPLGAVVVGATVELLNGNYSRKDDDYRWEWKLLF